MSDWLTWLETYWLSFSVIHGGIQLNIGYPVLVFLVMLVWPKVKRLFTGKNRQSA
jgi:hypothetical protein